MYATKRFLPDESLQGFDAKSEFTECQGTLGGNRTTAQTLQVLGQQVFRPIDNSQVFRAAAFDRGLRQPASSAHNEVQRLYDHAFATASGQLFPPPSGFFNARCVGHINLSVRRCEQETIAGFANVCQLFHVPYVIALNMNLSFCSQQVKRCEFQVAH